MSEANEVERVVSNRWRQVCNHLPPVNTKFFESDYVFCLEESGQPFTGWYNELTNAWYSADRDAPTLARHVVWWKPMMKLPKGY